MKFEIYFLFFFCPLQVFLERPPVFMLHLNLDSNNQRHCVRSPQILWIKRGRSSLECSLSCFDKSSCGGFNFFWKNKACQYFSTNYPSFSYVSQCISYQNECRIRTGADPERDCSFPTTFYGKLIYSCFLTNLNDICSFVCHNNQRNLISCQIPFSWSAQYKLINMTYPTINQTDSLLSIGGWIIFQNRPNIASSNFTLPFASYEEGFFLSDGSYWLGLEKLRDLTNFYNFKLRIEMKTIINKWYSVEYKIFKIGSPLDGYPLNVAFFQGDAGNAIDYRPKRFRVIGARFHSYDNCPSGCDFFCKGGWWINYCTATNLNAPVSSNFWQNIAFEGSYVTGSRMMIKKI